MNSSPPDYKKTHFPYPELDKIHGQPTIDQILKIYKQVKQNAASVPTTLAGGQHGFLPLVLTTEQWNNIQNVQPFERPANPGPFAPRAGRVTNAELAIDKSRWENRVHNYNNCQNLEATLKNQLTAAFDYDILDGLRDRTTNTLKNTIPQIIKYLFEEYGELSPEELLQKEDSVKNYVYDPNLPVSTIFNEILNLKDLYELTGSILQESDMIRYGYTILNRARIFKEYLLKWNNKPPNEKTWDTFQQFFRKAYRDLKQVNALQIQDSTLNHTTIMEELKHHQAQSLNQITNAFKDGIYETINHITDYEKEQDKNSDLSANATITSLQKEINELKNMLNQMVRKQNQPMQTQRKKKPRQYCWTHGWCAHSGATCNSKADGHQDHATLENKMGGSTKYCPST